MLSRPKAFALFLSLLEPPAAPRPHYRASGLVLGRNLAVAWRPLDDRAPPRRPPAICYVRSTSNSGHLRRNSAPMPMPARRWMQAQATRHPAV